MHVKKNKAYIPVFCLQILLCLFLNWGGDQLVSRWNWPVWMDSFGTMLTAYLLGPWCAAIVGATTNLLGHILYGIPWWYALVSVAIGLIAGFAAKKKWLDTLLGTLTTGAIMAAATRRRWLPQAQAGGTIRCTLSQRDHMVVVDVVPNGEQSFSIRMVQSNIPVRKYDQWVNNLSREIVYQASR